jgi:hypothetical protein
MARAARTFAEPVSKSDGGAPGPRRHKTYQGRTRTRCRNRQYRRLAISSGRRPAGRFSVRCSPPQTPMMPSDIAPAPSTCVRNNGNERMHRLAGHVGEEAHPPEQPHGAGEAEARRRLAVNSSTGRGGTNNIICSESGRECVRTTRSDPVSEADPEYEFDAVSSSRWRPRGDDVRAFWPTSARTARAADPRRGSCTPLRALRRGFTFDGVDGEAGRAAPVPTEERGTARR